MTRRKLGWLDWGLLAYVLLLAGIGAAVVIVVLHHRQFDSLTVMPRDLREADTLTATSRAGLPAAFGVSSAATSESTAHWVDH